MYHPWNLGGLNPSFFVIWGGLAPPSPCVEPPLCPNTITAKETVKVIVKSGYKGSDHQSVDLLLMLLSPLFMLLCSAVLTIAIPSSLVSWGFGWRSRDGSTGLPCDLLEGSIYAGCIALAFILIQESCLLCGGACLTGFHTICTSSATLSFLLVQAVAHYGPLFTVIWWSHPPGMRQCRPVLFLWLVQQPGLDFQ